MTLAGWIIMQTDHIDNSGHICWCGRDRVCNGYTNQHRTNPLVWLNAPNYPTSGIGRTAPIPIIWLWSPSVSYSMHALYSLFGTIKQDRDFVTVTDFGEGWMRVASNPTWRP